MEGGGQSRQLLLSHYHYQHYHQALGTVLILAHRVLFFQVSIHEPHSPHLTNEEIKHGEVHDLTQVVWLLKARAGAFKSELKASTPHSLPYMPPSRPSGVG